MLSVNFFSPAFEKRIHLVLLIQFESIILNELNQSINYGCKKRTVREKNWHPFVFISPLDELEFVSFHLSTPIFLKTHERDQLRPRSRGKTKRTLRVGGRRGQPNSLMKQGWQ